MYEKIFSQIGLTEQEAIIYEIMLELGRARAKEIYQKSPFKRGLVYKLLDNLIEKHLILRIDKPGKVSIFQIEHPERIGALAEAQERKFRHYRKNVENLMPELISNYNLAFNKPGIKFYEGLEGMRKVLEDTLKSKTEIYLFLNKNSLEQEEVFRELNKKYKIKREKVGIKKKIIRVGTKKIKKEESARNYASITEIRYFQKKMPDFKASVQIYDNKISYQIIDKDQIISIIIEDKNIFELNKIWFEDMWEKSLS
ncbi:MAG: hypothetical protein GX765_04655 [Candidatus Moranbacteria bacterium]|nr:hypothetical protein [Candidatus Moranbacteria bacterium]